MAEAKRVALIDLSYLFRKAWHGAEHSASVNSAYEVVLQQCERIREKYDAAAICIDAPPYKRSEVYAEYKANREAPDQQMIGQFKRLKERMARMFPVLSAKGYEADDVIATATAQLRAKGHKVFIVSPDKDLAQLVDDSGVLQVIPAVGDRDNEVRCEAEIEAKFLVPPSKLLDLLALVGDKSDNVPGCPGVGPKKAKALLDAGDDLDGVLNQCVAEVEDEGAKASKLAQLVVEHADNIRLSKELIALATDAPIDALEIFKPREVKGKKEVTMPEADAEFVDPGVDPEDVISPPPAAKAEPPQPKSEPRNEAPRAAAIVKATPAAVVSFRDGLEPSGLKQAVALAEHLNESRLFAKRFQSAEAIMGVIIAGRELGMGAMSSLRNFHFFEGQLVMHAHLITAQAVQHPDCEYFQWVKGDGESCTYETKRRGNPRATELTYTIKEAQLAGLLEIKKDRQPGNWHKRPAEMLRKTCAVQLARIEYPEVTAGLYCPEELPGGEVIAA